MAVESTRGEIKQ